MRRRLCAVVLVLIMCVPMVAAARGGAGGGGSPTAPVVVPDPVPVVPVAPVEPTSTAGGGGRGNDDAGDVKGELYGDLYVIVRDLNGVPITHSWVWNPDGTIPLYPLADPDGFSQPIAYDPEGALPAEFLGLVPLDAEGMVPEAYAAYTQPVDFGRLSLARAPDYVIDQAYGEAIAAINACDAIGLDPAGRLLLTAGDVVKAIDSPRENLALYRELMLNGFLPGLTRDSTFMGSLAHLCEQGASEMTTADLDRAACFLAAAGDKGASVSVDEVIYINNFLGINDLTTASYFPFVGMGYTYRRTNAYGGVEAVLLQGPVGGEHAVMFYLDQHVNIMGRVFGDREYMSAEVGAREFARAADDSLQVIEYVHNWEAPEY